MPGTWRIGFIVASAVWNTLAAAATGGRIARTASTTAGPSEAGRAATWSWRFSEATRTADGPSMAPVNGKLSISPSCTRAVQPSAVELMAELQRAADVARDQADDLAVAQERRQRRRDGVVVVVDGGDGDQARALDGLVEIGRRALDRGEAADDAGDVEPAALADAADGLGSHVVHAHADPVDPEIARHLRPADARADNGDREVGRSRHRFSVSSRQVPSSVSGRGKCRDTSLTLQAASPEALTCPPRAHRPLPRSKSKQAVDLPKSNSLIHLTSRSGIAAAHPRARPIEEVYGMRGTGRVERGRAATWLTLAAFAMALAATPVHAADPVKIGMVAALSGQSAASGEAITRGLPWRSTRSMPRAACSGAGSSS